MVTQFDLGRQDAVETGFDLAGSWERPLLGSERPLWQDGGR